MARERNTPVILLGKRLFLGALVLAVLLVVPEVWGVYGRERASRALRDEALRELRDLEAREARLAAKMESLATPFGLEAALREQYSLAREGEKLIVIVERSLPEQSASPGTNIATWFRRVLNW